ncbi:T9SS type A sorting domain-containing protein [Hymenobacter monticola]|uniref:T9SS type A sorting domain-containing protein n=2 Tax=Hymenobacter monticola TaxID=1705399 RepID=A0ABY4BBN8_9BACT|nr:T9SS type A sorting domain-containing protein [Hymenobacter monticola]UOE36309.1 T9SS type A sorting domain-containing protein [Hymenobacter monticola]
MLSWLILTRAVSILPGLPSGGFGLQADYFTGKSVADVALDDVDGDGRLDVIAVNVSANIYTPGDVSVLLNLGGGNLAPAVNYPMGERPTRAALGDMNGDGRLDLITANAATISVLPRLATGGFGAAADYPTGSEPTCPALSDVNGDGRLDVVTANLQGQSVSVLLGSSGGGFSPKVDYPTGPYPSGLALGDVNGDGLLDIVASSTSAGTASVLLGLPGGIFGLKTDYSTGANPRSLALRDLNGDGRLDIVTANTNSNTVSVLLNTGTYTPLATARPASPSDIALAPNPAHEAFAVTLPAGRAATSAELLNALGQVVRRPAVAGPSFQVLTNGLAPGVYSLRLTTSAGTVTKRVVVQ